MFISQIDTPDHIQVICRSDVRGGFLFEIGDIFGNISLVCLGSESSVDTRFLSGICTSGGALVALGPSFVNLGVVLTTSVSQTQQTPSTFSEDDITTNYPLQFDVSPLSRSAPMHN